jgi:hypothetical protein
MAGAGFKRLAKKVLTADLELTKAGSKKKSSPKYEPQLSYPHFKKKINFCPDSLPKGYFGMCVG